MNNFSYKEFLAQRKGAAALTGAATVLAVASLILYVTTGTNKLSPELFPMAIAMFAVAACCGVAYFAVAIGGRSFAIICFAQAVCVFYAFCEFIVSQLGYISNVFYGVDGNTFSVGLIATVVCSLASLVCAVCAGCLSLGVESKASKEKSE